MLHTYVHTCCALCECPRTLQFVFQLVNVCLFLQNHMDNMRASNSEACEEGEWALAGPPARIHHVQAERLVVMKHMHTGRAPGILLFRTTDPRMLFGSAEPGADIITNDSLRLILPPCGYYGTQDSRWCGQCNRDRLGWSMFVTHSFGGKFAHYRIFHTTRLQARESRVVEIMNATRNQSFYGDNKVWLETLITKTRGDPIPDWSGPQESYIPCMWYLKGVLQEWLEESEPAEP